MMASVCAFFVAVTRFIGLLWLTVLYFTIVLPFGIVARVRAAATRTEGAAAWRRREERAGDMREARKQF
jgi:hypothetical protein